MSRAVFWINSKRHSEFAQSRFGSVTCFPSKSDYYRSGGLHECGLTSIKRSIY